MSKRHFIIQCVFLSLSFCLFFSLFVSLTTSLARPVEEPQYREFTLLSTERIYHIRSGVQYNVYVEETDKPLRIYNIVYLYADFDVDALEAIPSGETITAGIEKERRSKIDVSSLKYGDQTILSFESYVYAQRRNQVIGIVVTSILSLMFSVCFFWGVISYKKKGNVIMFCGGEKDFDESTDQTE